MPTLSREAEAAPHGDMAHLAPTSVAPVIADPQQHHSQLPTPHQTSSSSSPPVQSNPTSLNSQQQQSHQQPPHQHLQAGAVSPEVIYSDEHYEPYDSDMEADLDLGPCQETLHEGQILKSGYLHKKGERIKIWKKKWFVLRTSKLAYYKDNKEYVLHRIIDIRDIHKAAEVVVKNRTGVFVILTPRRTYTVQADSVAEMEEWIQAINQAKVQYELTSSSDMDSSLYSGSTPQLERQANSAPQSGSRRTELVKQGSGTFLPRRQQHPMSLSDPGLLTSTNAHQNGEGPVGGLGRNMLPPTSSPLPRISDPKVSGLSLGIMNQSMGQTLHTLSSTMHNGLHQGPHDTNDLNSTSRHLQPNGGRAADDLSLVTSGTQAIQIGGISSPSSPLRQGHHDFSGSYGDFPPNSFSSAHSFHTSPGTPNSPGYGSSGDQFGVGELNTSSEEEDVVDDPTVLEAGRVAAAANAPGSGLVTGEQLESKVVRQGYLLKLGNTYKTWRKKWFVLRGDKLTYYKNAKEYQPLGIIPLSTIIDSLQMDPVSKHKRYCLRIVTSKRSFVCCAPDEDTLLQWIDALHVECARVARESKREKEMHDGTATADEVLLSDPRALGRTAHLEAHGTSPQQQQHHYGHSGDGSGVFGSSAQLNKALNLDTGGHGTGVAMPISFSSSPVSMTGPALSVSFQDGNTTAASTTTPTTAAPGARTSPATVTFSV
ncbi:hypothetical protein EDD11_000015 [Mortierella claussenii]|nr:hypothetical protein EDD11_000015 [Mortierella claussenii]